MAENANALNRLKPLTVVLLEHWERPRRMAEEKATDLEERTNKTKAALEKAESVKSFLEGSKKEWKKKARDLRERLDESERRAERAKARVKEGAARIAAAEQAVRELRLKLGDKERTVDGERRLKTRRRIEARHTRERQENALKYWRRYTGSGL